MKDAGGKLVKIYDRQAMREFIGDNMKMKTGQEGALEAFIADEAKGTSTYRDAMSFGNMGWDAEVEVVIDNVRSHVLSID